MARPRQSGTGGSGADIPGSEQDLQQTVIAASANNTLSNRALDIRV